MGLWMHVHLREFAVNILKRDIVHCSDAPIRKALCRMGCCCETSEELLIMSSFSLMVSGWSQQSLTISVPLDFVNTHISRGEFSQIRHISRNYQEVFLTIGKYAEDLVLNLSNRGFRLEITPR
jgi:hypothetical protein